MIFSIIIAAYNVAPFIRQAIDSCIHQVDFPQSDYEVIVIDDGAKDETGSIIDEYANYSNVRIVHQENQGLSGTRNRGIQLAQGEFILFLDGDDWLRGDALNMLSKKLSSVDLVVFPMTYAYLDGKKIVKRYNLSDCSVFSSLDLLKGTLGSQQLNIIPAPCKCYRKSILLNMKQKFIEGILHEDNAFFADTAHNFSCVSYLDEGIYMYRQQREGSITKSQTLRNFKGMITGNQHILKVWGFKNKYINYMISCTSVFQVILDYEDVQDVSQVIRYYRRLKEKKIAVRQLLNYPFIPKAIIRHILLVIDPLLLRNFIKKYYH